MQPGNAHQMGVKHHATNDYLMALGGDMNSASERRLAADGAAATEHSEESAFELNCAVETAS